MKDFLGRDIEINDYVVFIKHTDKRIRGGKVISFTNKKVRIMKDYLGAEWGHEDYGIDIVFPYDLVVVDKGGK